MYIVSDRNEDKARHEWRAELREDRVLIFLSLLGPSLLYFFAVSFFSRFHHTAIPRKDRQRISPKIAAIRLVARIASPGTLPKY